MSSSAKGSAKMKYATNVKRSAAVRNRIVENASKKAEQMKISVVTVCFNEEHTIRDTIESVIGQDYDDYDYVIMDGGSSDNTLEIINEFADRPNLSYYSEPDNGLYDAMNKSLDKISGDYVIFMNSGDMFYDSCVLSDVAGQLDSDIVYGNVYRRCAAGDHIETYKGTHSERIITMLCGKIFCHQSQFTRTSVMREYGFRESHKITADYDFVVRALSDKRSFKHVNRVICSFDNDGGMSADMSNYRQMIKEDDASIRECFPILFYLTIIPKTLFRILFRPSFRI